MTELLAVDACPLCGSTRRRDHSIPIANLYSEVLARIADVFEDDLLVEMSNVRCNDCGLIYKGKRLHPGTLTRLFEEGVPDHPRGWDVVSGRFSADNFERELAAYSTAIAEGRTDQINRYRRSLESILDAIPKPVGQDEWRGLRKAIGERDVDLLRASIPKLRSTMVEPIPYSRFSGFSSASLWEYFTSALGPIASYAEVGCPLWGLLRRAKSAGCRAIYLRRTEPNYWSTGCRRDGMHCVDRLVALAGIPTADWDDLQTWKYDLIGAFQYLDHLDAPGRFMDCLFQRTRAVAFILDAVDAPVAIQHLTGWTPEAMMWVAKRYGCRMHAEFTDIHSSGNRLFLLVRTDLGPSHT